MGRGGAHRAEYRRDPKQLYKLIDDVLLPHFDTDYAARLVLRDTAKAPQPYLPGGKSPLSARIPGPAATRAILAEARAKAEVPLLPMGAQSGEAFRFPTAAQAALAELDPREAVSLQFVFAGPSGDLVRTAFLEVGDFTAARRFVDGAQR